MEQLTAEPFDCWTQLMLNRPASRNALYTSLPVDTAKTLDRQDADPSCCATMMCGAGGNFAAGADIAEIENKGSIEGAVDARKASWAAIGAFPKPLVAAVDEFASGGGLELALMKARNVLTDEISDAGQSFDRNLATQMSGGSAVTVGAAVTQRLAGRTPLVLAAAKRAWVVGTEAALALATQRPGFEALLDSADKADGIRVFRDKCRPDVRGE